MVLRCLRIYRKTSISFESPRQGKHRTKLARYRRRLLRSLKEQKKSKRGRRAKRKRPKKYKKLFDARSQRN